MAAAWFNHLSQLQTSNSELQTSNARLQTANDKLQKSDSKVQMGHAASTESRAISAGTSPADRVHPEVVDVMKEVGIDLSSAKPQKLTVELARGADLLVTMGCGDKCPYVPGLKVEDWPLEDPKGKPIEQVREIRDEIRRRVERLLDS
jgi:arsenate reductase